MLEQDQAVRSLEPNRAGNILLVDDDPGVLEVVRAMLESLGYAVVDWSDSLDAYIDLKSRPDFFDLVLTDFKMPGVDGLEPLAECSFAMIWVGVIAVAVCPEVIIHSAPASPTARFV